MRSTVAHVTLVMSVALGAIASPCIAQTRVTSLEELRRELAAGDLVTVVPAVGPPVAGRLTRLGTVDIDLRPANQRALTGARPAGCHHPSRCDSVARTAPGLCTKWRGSRGRHRRGVWRSHVRPWPHRRPQRDRRVGGSLCWSRGGLHRDWRADRMGGRCCELETAHQVRRAFRGKDESQRPACVFAGSRDSARGVILTIVSPRAGLSPGRGARHGTPAPGSTSMQPGPAWPRRRQASADLTRSRRRRAFP